MDDTESATDEEIQLFTTDYEPEPDDSIVDVIRGRLHFAITDQIEHMIYGAEIGNPNEIKKIILRDIKDYIDSYEPKAESESST